MFSELQDHLALASSWSGSEKVLAPLVRGLVEEYVVYLYLDPVWPALTFNVIKSAKYGFS
jgi:hypothetical protein